MDTILEMITDLVGGGVRYLFFKLIGSKKDFIYFSGKTQEILTILFIFALVVYIQN